VEFASNDPVGVNPVQQWNYNHLYTVYNKKLSIGGVRKIRKVKKKCWWDSPQEGTMGPGGGDENLYTLLNFATI